MCIGGLAQRAAAERLLSPSVCPLRVPLETLLRGSGVHRTSAPPSSLPRGNKEIQPSGGILSLPHEPAQLSMTPLCISESETDTLISETKRLSHPRTGRSWGFFFCFSVCRVVISVRLSCVPISAPHLIGSGCISSARPLHQTWVVLKKPIAQNSFCQSRLQQEGLSVYNIFIYYCIFSMVR